MKWHFGAAPEARSGLRNSRAQQTRFRPARFA